MLQRGLGGRASDPGSTPVARGCVTVADMPVDPDVRQALQCSHFGVLPEGVLARLVAGAVRLDVAAGTNLIVPGSTIARVMVMVAGVAKTYLTAASGRLATIRYARRGDIVAAPLVFDERPSPAGSRTLTASTVLAFQTETLRALVTSDVRVANVFNMEMAERLRAYFAELAGTAFGSLRERVVRHLLDVASEQQTETSLVARVSQQELADAVGSVREVVARVLARLREDGLVRTVDGGVELLDLLRLAEESAPGVTKVTPAGDIGR